MSAPRVVADNRRARHDYAIEDTYEAGIILEGTEVKALREGRANITEAYATEEDGEIWLINAYIAEYSAGNRNNHAPRRKRKLLLRKPEMAKMIGAVRRKGYTLVPLKLRFNDRGLVKLDVGLGRAKQSHDKREDVKKRDWNRQKARIMREKG